MPDLAVWTGSSDHLGIELAHQEIVAGQTQNVAVYTDIAGLSVTFVARGRPVMVRLKGRCLAAQAGGQSHFKVTNPAATIDYLYHLAHHAIVNHNQPIPAARRLTLVKGAEYTMKARFAAGGNYDSTLTPTAASPFSLQVIEI